MDNMVKQMVQPLLDAFNMYEVKSQALQEEIDKFKDELVALGEASDMTSYYTKFAESGLQEKYTDLISKVAVASYSNDSDTPKEETAAAPQITVKDFLEQYRSAYNELCKRNSVRGKQAYEAVFAVADRTDDMLEAQIILEKERLLWNIVKEDAVEIFERKLEEMDPLFLASTAVLIGQLEAYNSSDSEEELLYRLGLQEVEDYRIILDFTCRMNIAALIADELAVYIKSKEMVYDWINDELANKGVLSMIGKKRNIRSIIDYLREYLDISLDELFGDPGIAIWMLRPANMDENGRRNKVFNPEYLDSFRRIIDEEILADVSVLEALCD